MPPPSPRPLGQKSWDPLHRGVDNFVDNVQKRKNVRTSLDKLERLLYSLCRTFVLDSTKKDGPWGRPLETLCRCGGMIMQTVYYTPKTPLAPRNNIVDLAEYRRRLEAVQPEEEQVPAPFQPRQRRSRRRQLWGLFWDAARAWGSCS